MTTFGTSIANEKRDVLLVDIHLKSRDSRADAMRKLGATVDSVSSAALAIARLASRLYRLVLIDLGEDQEGAEQLARDIRRIKPKQLVGFLVGSPAYISKTLVRDTKGDVPFPVSTTTTSIAEPELAHESAFGRRVREVEQSHNPK